MVCVDRMVQDGKTMVNCYAGRCVLIQGTACGDHAQRTNALLLSLFLVWLVWGNGAVKGYSAARNSK